MRHVDPHTRRLIEIATLHDLAAMLDRRSVTGGHLLTPAEHRLIEARLDEIRALEATKDA